MSAATTRNESFVSIALIALLLLVGVALTDVANPQPDLRCSTFVNDPTGLRGLYLTLEEAGLDVSRTYDPVPVNAPTDRTLVLAAPTDPVLDEELEDLLDWVAAGGRLVIIDQPSAAPLHIVYTDALRLALGRRATHFTQQLESSVADLHPDLPHRNLTIDWRCRRQLQSVREDILAPHERRRDPRVGEPALLVGGDEASFAEEFAVGEGSVVLVADTLGFDNEGLGRADNALLAADLLAGRDGTAAQIVFDEFHHGFRSDGQKGDVAQALVGLLWHTWPGRAVLTLLLAFAVFVAGRTVRFGAPSPVPRSRRRALTEHTSALGQVYAAARARNAALQLIAGGVRRRIGPRVGLSSRLTAAEFDRRLADCSAPGAAELAQALRAAQSASGKSNAELVTLAHDMTDAKRRFIHGRS